MISGALTVSILAAASAMAAAYALGGRWLPALAVLLLGALWIAVERTGWSWAASLMLGLFSFAATAGAWQGLNPVLLVVGMVGALSAWDLDHFTRQLRSVDDVEEERSLSRRHLRRLLVVDALGLASAGVALTVRVRLSFGVALVLGLVAILGLSQAIGFVRREGG